MRSYTKYSIFLISYLLVFLISCREDAITVLEYGSVEGYVYDAETLEPIAGVSVSTNPATTSINTDTSGYFSFTEIPTAEYNLRFEKDGYSTAFEPVGVLVDQTIQVEVNMEEFNSTTNLSPVPPVLILLINSESSNPAIFSTGHWTGGRKPNPPSFI